MFHFLGRKKRIVRYYPKPEYDTIIEPFAGSASYSMHYYQKNVILIEKDPVIFEVWNYIIHEATKERILSFPLIGPGESIEQFECLSKVEKDLIGFFLGFGSKPRKRPSKSPNFCKWNEKSRQLLSEDVLKVKHWKVFNNSYESIDNIEATWFIDPPYKGNGGKYYRQSNKDINYLELGNYCTSRKGQVIVCENEEGDWLAFKKLVNQNQQGRSHIEMVYIQ